MDRTELKIVRASLIVLSVLGCVSPKPAYRDLPPRQQDCLLECLSCVELWGSMYDGNACAHGCLLTNGSSIDTDCKDGVHIGKRVEELAAIERCNQQCGVCDRVLPDGRYDVTQCRQQCLRRRGNSVDVSCDQHLLWNDLTRVLQHVK